MITAEFSLQFEFATHLCYKKNFHFKDDIRIVQSYLRIPVSLRCGKASYKKKISNQKNKKKTKKKKRKLYLKTFTDHHRIFSCFVRETSTGAKKL